MPAAALTSAAIVHERLATAPQHRRAAPAPGAPIDPSDRLPERGMDPGAVLLGLLGTANLSSRRVVFEQYDSTVGADTVAGPGRGAAVLARQEHDEGPGRLHGRQPGGRCAGSVPGCGPERRRGHPQRGHHRRPPAGRHELPQLRRPDPPRGVLAAQRGRPRPRRRVSGARVAGHGRQRLALQRIARWPDRPDARDRRRRSARGHRTARGTGLRDRGRPHPARRRVDAGHVGIRVRRAGRHRRRGRPAGPRPGARGGAPGVHPRGDRP